MNNVFYNEESVNFVCCLAIKKQNPGGQRTSHAGITQFPYWIKVDW